MPNSSTQRDATGRISIDSLLNDMVIEPQSEEATYRSDLPTPQAHHVAMSNGPRRRLPPLAPESRRSAVPARTVARTRISSGQHRTHSTSPQHSFAGPSTPRDIQHGVGSRQQRPKYQKEEEIFLWYMRTDLKLSWDKIEVLFNRQFPAYRKKEGLRCKFYRVLCGWGVARVRNQNPHPRDPKDHRSIGTYGVVQRTNMRFRWMELEHQHMPCLEEFR